MKKDVKQKYSKILLILFLLGAAIVVLNTKTEPTNIVTERTVDQSSNMFFTYTTIRYPARVEVLTPTLLNESLAIGFSTETDELDFSKVEAGSSVKKQLNLTTRDGLPSKITVMSKGSIKPLLKFGKSGFVLNGDDVVSVTMNSGKQDSGNYTGDVSVIIQRSNNDFLRGLLGY